MKQLDQSLSFILELDKLKSVIRQTLLLNQERLENSAEHSWHSTMMVLSLAKFANQPVDLLKVLKMQLIHDIVEIDAGDVLLYAKKNSATFEKEKIAAQRIFNLLPDPLNKELYELWLEFETTSSPEANFCRACDRAIPLLANLRTNGKMWKKNQITLQMVLEKNAHIAQGSQKLWDYLLPQIHQAADQGLLIKNQ